MKGGKKKIISFQNSQESEESKETILAMPHPPVGKYFFKKAILKLPDSPMLSYVILPDSWFATMLGNARKTHWK